MPAALPRDRVFVVKFSSDTDPCQGCLVGRVEHVDSGRSARFATGEEMNEFFARVLREIEAPGPPATPKTQGETTEGDSDGNRD